MMKKLKTYKQLFENSRMDAIIKRFRDVLIEAVQHDNIKLAKEIIEEGIDINFKLNDSYIISIAAKKGFNNMFDLLFEYNPTKESISETFYSLAFQQYLFGGYKKFSEMIFHILGKTTDFNFIKGNETNYFPFYFNDEDMEKFKKKYPDKYTEYVKINKVKDFNL